MISFRVTKLAVTESTNDDIRRAAESGEAEGLAIWALKQTAGRGRQSRRWESPEGNLYCSVLLRPKIDIPNKGQYSFVAALAIYDVVRAALPDADIKLKWPNDVLVSGKKISGILLEAGQDWMIVGIGLNVAHYPADALYPSTSIHNHITSSHKIGEANLSGIQSSVQNDIDLNDLAAMLDILLARLAYWYGVIQKDGFNPIRIAWLKHAQKGPITVRLPNGTIEGEFNDLDPGGNLRLKLADGSEKAIATGDVWIRD